jgi:hypothetical protein
MSQRPKYDDAGIVCPLYKVPCFRKECSDSDVCQRSRADVPAQPPPPKGDGNA